MKRTLMATSALLSLALPALTFAQVFTDSAEEGDKTFTSDSTVEVEVSALQAEQRIVNTFTQIHESIDLDNPTAFLDEVFDVRAYIAHPCYSIESEAEEHSCRLLFGDHFDLGAALTTGVLADILVADPRIRNADLIVLAIDQALEAAAEADEDGASVDVEGSTELDTRGSRSMRVWEECKAQTNVWALRRACFQDNLRLITDTNVSLDQRVNFSATWRDDSTL